MRTAPGRDHLWPKAPPRRVPWPDGINHGLPLKLASTDTSRLRADCVRPAETCEKVRRTFSVCSGASQTVIETRIRRCRADILRRNKPHLRAHIQIQTHMPPERYDRRPVRVVPVQYGCRPDDFCFHRSGGMYVLNLSMCATVQFMDCFTSARGVYARFDRCSRSEPKKPRQGLFCMFRLTDRARAKPWGFCRS